MKKKLQAFLKKIVNFVQFQHHKMYKEKYCFQSIHLAIILELD